MERLTIEQRVKVVEAYYENGKSNKNAFRALREYFGQHNRPTESAIAKNLWGYLKSKVYANKPTTIQQLKDEIRRHIDEIEDQLCSDVIRNFDHRIEVCQRSLGGHLGDIIFKT